MSAVPDETTIDPTAIKSEQTRMRQGAFLAAYGKLARINRAAEVADIDRGTHYDWMQTDPEYKKAFERAKELATQQLEDEAVRRAYEGVLKPTTVAGVRVDVQEFSDTMMIFLLKSLRPEVYRERYDMQHSGPGGKPLLDLSTVHEFLRRTSDK